MWQALSAHGLQTFATDAELISRREELEHALSELCLTISRETGDARTSGLERGRALRGRPAAGGKSHYECINQLIHYWYCCASARHLLRSGYERLDMRPTGHDNSVASDDDEETKGPYDLQAIHPTLGSFAAEVFCVSQALWPSKMTKTRSKLASCRSEIRAVFYNVEAKPKYNPKMERLIVFGVETPSGVVTEIASTVDA